MSIDTIFASAVEAIAREQGKELKGIVHDVMDLSTPDVSIREWRRVSRPDKNGRSRTLTLREGYELARALGMTVDDVVAYGVTHDKK
ncbi:MAG: hypothetical protein IJU76_10340 [Desulfovibrionaceae bacterium]|nr:hypothetical protein [Desulfovibrionaceae bacterium]